MHAFATTIQNDLANAPELGPLRLEHLDTAPEDFLQDAPEDSRFHRGFQAAKIPGFSDIGYYAAYRGNTRVSIVPYFIMDFHANTMLPEGILKRSLSWLHFKIACVGHASSDLCHIHGEVSADILEAVNQELAKKAKIVAYKDFSEDLPLQGFVKAKGLPVALLKIKGDYWSQLDKKSRHHLSRRLKKAKHLRIEEVTTLDQAMAERLHKLYLNAYERAPTKFEKLNVEYFIKTAPISRYMLFYEGEHLIGFCQLFKRVSA